MRTSSDKGLELRDGRKLAYCEYGGPQGALVFFSRIRDGLAGLAAQ